MHLEKTTSIIKDFNELAFTLHKLNFSLTKAQFFSLKNELENSVQQMQIDKLPFHIVDTYKWVYTTCACIKNSLKGDFNFNEILEKLQEFMHGKEIKFNAFFSYSINDINLDLEDIENVSRHLVFNYAEFPREMFEANVDTRIEQHSFFIKTFQNDNSTLVKVQFFVSLKLPAPIIATPIEQFADVKKYNSRTLQFFCDVFTHGNKLSVSKRGLYLVLNTNNSFKKIVTAILSNKEDGYFILNKQDSCLMTESELNIAIKKAIQNIEQDPFKYICSPNIEVQDYAKYLLNM